MKKKSMKNIFKACVALVFATSIAGCSNLIDDSQENSSAAQSVKNIKGSVIVKVGVPNYEKISASQARSARTIAPQSSFARMGYSTDGESFIYLSPIELSGGVADSTGLYTEYNLTFSGVPAGTYAKGCLQVQLLGSSASSSAVSEGTNAQAVTVSSSSSAATTFYTVPTTLATTTGSLTKGEMVFLSKEVEANSLATLTVTVGANDPYPLVALFNSDGSFKSATQLSASENTLKIDRDGGSESAVYYIGLYSKDADVSSYTAAWTDDVYFTKFDPDDLYALNGNNGNIKKDVSAADGSWSVTGGTDTAYAGAWTEPSKSYKTYDYDAEKGTGYDYSNSHLFFFNNVPSIVLKLKIGAGKTRVLRIDGGTDHWRKDYWYPGNTIVYNIKDSATETKTWSPYVSDSTYYIEVTGDNEGYVTISIPTKNTDEWVLKGIIYGITLADSVIDLSSTTRSEVFSEYRLNLTLDSTSANLSGTSNGVILTATAKPSIYSSTKTASIDGTKAIQGKTENYDSEETTELTDVSISYVWTKAGTVIEGATSSTYTATSSGTYTVTASYTDPDGEVHSASSSCLVFNSEEDFSNGIYRTAAISKSELGQMTTNVSSSTGTSTSTSLSEVTSGRYELADGTYTIWNKNGSITRAGKTLLTIYDGKVNSIDFNTSMTKTAPSTAPVVGNNVSALCTNGTIKSYLKVKVPSAGANYAILNISTSRSNTALTDSALSYWILITDTDGKILSVYDIGDIYGTSTTQAQNSYNEEDVTLKFDTLKADSEICIGFERGTGSGTLKIHSVTLGKIDYSTITFDKNSENASITETTQVVESGTTASLTTVSGLGLTNNGKIFKGWATSATATSAEYADGANISVTADTTLYAVWNDYVTVTFIPNYHNETSNYSATITTSTQQVEKGAATSLAKASELGLTNNEKVFRGWASTADAADREYKDAQDVTFTENTTLYAVWRDNFTKFTAQKLREEYLKKHTELDVGATNDVQMSDEFKYNYNNIIVSKRSQLKYQTGKTYDYDKSAGTGYSYNYRFNINSKDNNDSRYIKLRIGAGQKKILRIDGGSNWNLSDWTTDVYPSSTFTLTDKTGDKKWSTYVRYSTYYVEVTGCDDGYVTIKSDDRAFTSTSDVKSEIYGIYVVDSIPDLSSVKQTYSKTTYNSPVVTLEQTADLAGKESVALTASASTPTRTQTTISTSVDGSTKPATETSDENLSDVALSYQWYKSGVEIEGATSSTYNATSSATYSVKVSYSYTDENGDTTSKSTTAECVVSNSKTSMAIVSFDKNSSTASISTDEQEIERGATVSLAKAASLGLTNSGYAFMGWATSADGKVAYTDGADISFYSNTTLYAVWVLKSKGTLLGYSGTGSSLDDSGWKTVAVSETDSRLNPADITDSNGNTILHFVRWESEVKSRNRTGVDIDGAATAYTYSMSCSDTKTGSLPRFIEITVPEGNTADVFCAFSANPNRNVGIGTQIGQYYDVTEKVATISSSTLCYVTTGTALPAGTYYINVEASVDFSALQVRLYSEN